MQNHDTKTPFYISLVSVFLNIAISVYFFKSVGFIIIPIATSISSWFNLILLYFFLKKRSYLISVNFLKNDFLRSYSATFLMGILFNYLMIFLVNNYHSNTL